MSSLRVLKEEKYCYEAYATKWEVDPEALETGQ